MPKMSPHRFCLTPAEVNLMGKFCTILKIQETNLTRIKIVPSGGVVRAEELELMKLVYRLKDVDGYNQVCILKDGIIDCNGIGGDLVET